MNKKLAETEICQDRLKSIFGDRATYFVLVLQWTYEQEEINEQEQYRKRLMTVYKSYK